MADKLRLFIGVRLSAASLRAVAEAAEGLRAAARQQGLAVRWVPAASYHITLKFLGWARAEVLEAVRDRVARVAAGEAPFDVAARGSGAFPSPRRAQVLWIGLDDPAGRLARLAGRLDQAVTELGFAPEPRPFHAHVTLGRLREPQDVGEILLPIAERAYSATRVESVVLFESTMKSNGSEYGVRAEWRLGPPQRQTERVVRESNRNETPDDGQEPGAG